MSSQKYTVSMLGKILTFISLRLCQKGAYAGIKFLIVSPPSEKSYLVMLEDSNWM